MPLLDIIHALRIADSPFLAINLPSCLPPPQVHISRTEAPLDSDAVARLCPLCGDALGTGYGAGPQGTGQVRHWDRELLCGDGSVVLWNSFVC